MNNSLQLVTQNQIEKFTRGQVGLLRLIEDCVKNNKACDFEAVVLCYSKCVREIYTEEKYHYVGKYPNNERVYEYIDHNVYEAWKTNSWIWTYKIRALIKHWFVSTIGILVLKGKLIVLPIIQIEND